MSANPNLKASPLHLGKIKRDIDNFVKDFSWSEKNYEKL